MYRASCERALYQLLVKARHIASLDSVCLHNKSARAKYFKFESECSIKTLVMRPLRLLSLLDQIILSVFICRIDITNNFPVANVTKEMEKVSRHTS